MCLCNEDFIKFQKKTERNSLDFQTAISVDASLPDIQFITLETVPADCVVLTMTHPMFLVANNPAMMCSMKEEAAIQGIRINVPKCPFRYIYKSKHCTHYSYTAYSKLITPY